MAVGQLSDDSPRLQGGGFWNDAGVSSHTDRSVHAQERDKLKATPVSHGTMDQNGSVFTHDPSSWKPPKHYFVENVYMNRENIAQMYKRRKKGDRLDGGTPFILTDKIWGPSGATL